jgi:excisionase family DNA binding protein
LALKPAEAAEALSVSPRTLRRWMREADLPYFRLDGSVRIPIEGLRAWMRDRVQYENRSDEIAQEILRDL